MFTIPIGELLTSYTGDSREFTFEGEVFDGYFDDIQFSKPLQFRIHIITLDDGVNVLWDYMKTAVVYEGKKCPIDIASFDRTWKLHIDTTTDGDDVRHIEPNETIDLAPVIREEIIMACHTL